MIDRCRGFYPIRMMCRCLKVSASGYYGWRERPLSARERDNKRLVRRIESLHEASDGVMGCPSIWEELRYSGETCSLNRVARLMPLQDLKGIPQRRRWSKKPSGIRPDGVHNVLARDFAADEPNTKWVTYITYSAPNLGRRLEDAARA